MRRALLLALVLVSPSLAQGDLGMCPLMPWEPAKPQFYVDDPELGERVYLCCKRCRKKYLAGERPGTAAPAAGSTSSAGSTHSSTLAFEWSPLPGGDARMLPPVYPEGAPIEGEDEILRDHRAAIDGASRVPGVREGGWVAALGEWHPVLVHFPIALLLLGAVAELCFLWSRSPFFEHAARFDLMVGAASAPVAALLGLAAASGGGDPAALGDTFWWHRSLGIATGVSAPLVAWLSESSRGEGGARLRRVYLLALPLLAVLVAATGYLGGELVYGP